MLTEVIQVSVAHIVIIGLLCIMLGLIIGIRLAAPTYIP